MQSTFASSNWAEETPHTEDAPLTGGSYYLPMNADALLIAARAYVRADNRYALITKEYSNFSKGAVDAASATLSLAERDFLVVADAFRL